MLKNQFLNANYRKYPPYSTNNWRKTLIHADIMDNLIRKYSRWIRVDLR